MSITSVTAVAAVVGASKIGVEQTYVVLKNVAENQRKSIADAAKAAGGNAKNIDAAMARFGFQIKTWHLVAGGVGLYLLLK